MNQEIITHENGDFTVKKNDQMMEPEELRIGNWINDRRGNKCKVFALTSDKEETQITAYSGLITGYPLVPIPLNEEWLERFGLNNPTNDKPYHFLQGGLEYMWAEGQGLKVFGPDGVPWCSYPCDYVHQLQNLYLALTGKELELKNG